MKSILPFLTPSSAIKMFVMKLIFISNGKMAHKSVNQGHLSHIEELVDKRYVVYKIQLTIIMSK